MLYLLWVTLNTWVAGAAVFTFAALSDRGKFTGAQANGSASVW